MSKRFALLSAAGAAGLLVAVPAFAGIVSPTTTTPDAPGFAPGFAIVSPTANTPQASNTVNQQVGAGTSLVQTFRTGASSVLVDRIDLYIGGMAGGTARLNIYPDPVGGEDADGFVNTSFSTDLLNAGAGLEFTFNGSPGLAYLTLDLTGVDEITLAPNQQYALEIDVLTGQFSWQRSGAGVYPDGNLYSGSTEGGFNGTPPATNRGERFQVGGTPQRDAGFAVYAVVPEPASLGLLGIAGAGLLARRRRNA